MSKTTEQAANEYATNWETKHNIHNPELYDLIVDTYKASAERIMSLPLASRLTAEEKERVNKAYAYAITHIEFDENRAEVRLLHRIFGKDFFKEEE